MATGGHTAIRMGRQRMNSDVLTLSQLLSPSFPVGAFAYSHGLETAIDDGLITDATSLRDWVSDLMEHGSLRNDAVLLNLAYVDTDSKRVDAVARAFAASRERLVEADLQGAAFCDTVRDVCGLELGRICYPVAVGCTARMLTLDPELTAAMYAQAFVANMAAAAMRLVPLGQTDGQLVQTALKPMCLSLAAETQGASEDDLSSFAFLSDIVAMRHEVQSPRIFRT